MVRLLSGSSGEPCDALQTGVESCTDADTPDEPERRPRKEGYIAHLKHVPEQVLLVSCADKLRNARAIVADLRVMGNALFERFTGKQEGTLWYYGALAEVFGQRGPKHMADELGRTVATMKALAAS